MGNAGVTEKSKSELVFEEGPIHVTTPAFHPGQPGCALRLHDGLVDRSYRRFPGSISHDLREAVVKHMSQRPGDRGPTIDADAVERDMMKHVEKRMANPFTDPNRLVWWNTWRPMQGDFAAMDGNEALLRVTDHCREALKCVGLPKLSVADLSPVMDFDLSSADPDTLTEAGQAFEALIRRANADRGEFSTASGNMFGIPFNICAIPLPWKKYPSGLVVDFETVFNLSVYNESPEAQEAFEGTWKVPEDGKKKIRVRPPIKFDFSLSLALKDGRTGLREMRGYDFSYDATREDCLTGGTIDDREGDVCPQSTGYLVAFNVYATHCLLTGQMDKYELVDRDASTIRGVKKISPNSPCPCGSGKKAKKCCYR